MSDEATKPRSAEVTIMPKGDITPQQLLAQLMAQAQNGEIKEVFIVFTKQNGELSVGHSSCKASSLAAAAVIMHETARNALMSE